MTSKLVVNTIEADTGISSVSFASSISMSSTSKFHFSDAGIDIGADTNINRPATGVLGFNINSSEKARIDSSGRVLIGTTTEGAAAADDLTIASSGHTGITIRAGSTSQSAIYMSDSTSGAAEYAGNIIYDHNDNHLRFATNATERLRIDSSGRIANNARVPSSFGSPNLLISGTDSTLTLMGDGSTNSSSFTGIKFRVAGASAGDYTKAGIFSRREGGYNDLSIIFALNTDANANSVAISDEKLRITSSGRLGLGTNNPDSLLHVYGASVGYVKIETGDGSTNPIIMHKNPDRTWHAGLRGDTGDSYVIRDASASPAANRLIINTSGAFGLNGTNYGTSGQVLTSQGSGSAVQWANVAAGITMMDQWSITNDNNKNNGEVINSHWERADYFFAQIGTGMSESSGIFTFPQTGIYLIMCQHQMNGGASYAGVGMELSTNSGSSYGGFSYGYQKMTGGGYHHLSIHGICDVTNASTHRFRLVAINAASTQYSGNTERLRNGVTFIRLGDT